MSSTEPPSSAAEKRRILPVEGGAWRPVAPDELIRRNQPADDGAEDPAAVKVTIERRQHLERYLRDRPADVDAYMELASIYRANGRAVDARRILKTAHEISPENTTVLWALEEADLARALQQLKDVREVAERLPTPEAQRELERAKVDWANRRADVCRARLDRDPKNDHLRVVMAEALREQGNLAEAIEVLEPTLANDVEAPMAYLILGNCKNHQGKLLAALAAWRKAAMRRSAPAPAKVKIAALKAALVAAQHLGLTATLPIYQAALKQAEEAEAG